MVSLVMVAILVMILAVALVFIIGIKTGGIRKRPTDYKTMFILGICWIPLGIPLKNYAFTIMGIVFMIIGLAHRKEWEKNSVKWKDMTEKERKFKYWLIGILLLGIVAGVIMFFVAKGI